jgi:hypothetical protein
MHAYTPQAMTHSICGVQGPANGGLDVYQDSKPGPQMDFGYQQSECDWPFGLDGAPLVHRGDCERAESSRAMAAYTSASSWPQAPAVRFLGQ